MSRILENIPGLQLKRIIENIGDKKLLTSLFKKDFKAISIPEFNSITNNDSVKNFKFKNNNFFIKCKLNGYPYLYSYFFLNINKNRINRVYCVFNNKSKEYKTFNDIIIINNNNEIKKFHEFFTEIKKIWIME